MAWPSDSIRSMYVQNVLQTRESPLGKASRQYYVWNGRCALHTCMCAHAQSHCCAACQVTSRLNKQLLINAPPIRLAAALKSKRCT
jgi:hypothetical protein